MKYLLIILFLAGAFTLPHHLHYSTWDTPPGGPPTVEQQAVVDGIQWSNFRDENPGY